MLERDRWTSSLFLVASIRSDEDQFILRDIIALWGLQALLEARDDSEEWPWHIRLWRADYVTDHMTVQVCHNRNQSRHNQSMTPEIRGMQSIYRRIILGASSPGMSQLIPFH